MTSAAVFAAVAAGAWLAPGAAGNPIRLGHAPQAFAVAPSGRHFAVARDTNWIDIWGLPAGKKVQSVRCLDGDRVAVLAFSPDGKSLAAGAWYTGVLRVWAADTGAERFAVSANENGIRALAFSPDGKVLAAGGEDGHIRLFDTRTGKPLAALHERHDREGYVTALAFHPSGRRLAAASSYDTLGHVWRVEPPGRVRVFDGHASAGPEGYSLAFTPDGRSLVLAAGSDRVVRLEAATGGVRWAAPAGEPLTAVAVSPDGRIVVGCGPFGQVVRVWDADTGAEVAKLRGHRGQVVAVQFAGGALVSAGSDGMVRVWRVPPPDRVIKPHNPPITVPDLPPVARLAGADPAAAFAAIRELAADPAAAVRLARGRLKPAARPDAATVAEVRKLVAALSGEDFDARQAAADRLRKLAPAAGTELLRARRAATDPEAAFRLDQLLRDAGRSPDDVAPAEARWLELLERVNTAEARAAVKELAGGDPDAPLTRDAADTLARMGRRPE
jgi:hypothetical protein